MPELIEIAIRSYSDDCVAYRRRDRSPMVCSYDQAMSLALDLLDQSPADSSQAATWGRERGPAPQLLLLR